MALFFVAGVSIFSGKLLQQTFKETGKLLIKLRLVALLRQKNNNNLTTTKKHKHKPKKTNEEFSLSAKTYLKFCKNSVISLTETNSALLNCNVIEVYHLTEDVAMLRLLSHPL